MRWSTSSAVIPVAIALWLPDLSGVSRSMNRTPIFPEASRVTCAVQKAAFLKARDSLHVQLVGKFGNRARATEPGSSPRSIAAPTATRIFASRLSHEGARLIGGRRTRFGVDGRETGFGLHSERERRPLAWHGGGELRHSPTVRSRAGANPC